MTSERYNPRDAEARWQRAWDERGIYSTKNSDPRPKYYVLEMFPYPSGRIHMGHVREFATCDPSYYKHQQKMFLDFLQAGLAEREQRKLNWDPVDQTVLANEQVIDGRGWRSGAVVEQREMSQWVFKITKYSQDLLDA